VILVDANILIYAYVETFAHHQSARDWLDDRLNGSDRVGMPWSSLLAFVRITTNPRIFQHPKPMAEVWRQVRDWISCESAWIPTPSERHSALLAEMLSVPGIRGDLVPDAHLAALAIEYGLTLCSADGDFARFPRLRWLNPIARQ
jgi:toxin-antitoxin system PIN domain toxin